MRPALGISILKPLYDHFEPGRGALCMEQTPAGS